MIGDNPLNTKSQALENGIEKNLVSQKINGFFEFKGIHLMPILMVTILLLASSLLHGQEAPYFFDSGVNNIMLNKFVFGFINP